MPDHENALTIDIDDEESAADSPNDFAWAVIDEYLARYQFGVTLEGLVSNKASGVVRDLPDSDGLYDCRAIDELGNRYSGRLSRESDSQTNACSQESQSLNHESEPVEIRLASELARDQTLSAQSRADGLFEWLAESRDEAGEFVCEELFRSHLDFLWQDTIILAAESASFNPSASDQIGDRLIALADQLRSRTPAPQSEIVFSAILRGASLIDSNKIGLLLTFLTQKGPVDTRLAALQAVVRILEVEREPIASESRDLLISRIEAIVGKHIDPDVFAPGSVAAIVKEGLIALELLKSGRGAFILRERAGDLPGWFHVVAGRQLGSLHPANANRC